MKTLTKNILPLILVLITTLFIGSSCKGDEEKNPPEDTSCATAITYKIDGVLTTHIEDEPVTSEIWGGTNYPINKKVYDIWTDEAPTFNFHTSASTQDEVSGHVGDWQDSLGSTLVLNTVGLESDGLEFKIVQEAWAVGDLVKISFSGTTAGGKVITEGLICTYIDIVHQ